MPPFSLYFVWRRHLKLLPFRGHLPLRCGRRDKPQLRIWPYSLSPICLRKVFSTTLLFAGGWHLCGPVPPTSIRALLHGFNNSYLSVSTFVAPTKLALPGVCLPAHTLHTFTALVTLCRHHFTWSTRHIACRTVQGQGETHTPAPQLAVQDGSSLPPARTVSDLVQSRTILRAHSWTWFSPGGMPLDTHTTAPTTRSRA